MFDSKDEEWLKKVLNDCFDNKSGKDRNGGSLEGFRILVRNLVENLEQKFEEIWVLWQRDSESKELKEKFHLLKKNLFYLIRFCKPR